MLPSALLRRLSFALLVVVPLVACRKADPEARAQLVAEKRPAAVTIVADAAVVADPAVVEDPAALALRAQLAGATAIVLYAIDPEHANSKGRPPSPDDFHGFPIRKTVPIPPADVAAVAAAVRGGLGKVPPTHVPACFDPHHGLRVTTATGTIDLVICFACSQINAFQGESKLAWDTTDGGADSVLARYVGETPSHGEPWPIR